jgi:ABC-type phosphate transport system substrate-binding protein
MRQPNDYRFANVVVLAPFAAGTMQVFLLTFFRLKRIMLLCAIILLPNTPLKADDLKPVLLDSNGQAKLLSSETVREIFFMRLSSWPDGSPIHVFVLPDNNPLHARFAKEILGVYPFQLRSAWDRMVYSGTGVSPTTVETPEEMQMRIKQTPGAIGYIGK